MGYVVAVILSLVVGFILGEVFNDPVRAEIKKLHDKLDAVLSALKNVVVVAKK